MSGAAGATSGMPVQHGAASWRDLVEIAIQLGDDELRVLVSIARRLRIGAGVYGTLDIASDTRAFRAREARQELEDALVYFACAWLKAQAAEPTSEGGVR